MNLQFRLGTMARKVGDSLIVTIPHLIAKEWNLKPGDQLVVYLIDNQAVLVPLAYLGILGEPEMVKRLTRSLDSQLSSDR